MQCRGGSLYSVVHQWELLPWTIASFGKLKVVQVVMNVRALHGGGWFITAFTSARPRIELSLDESIFYSHILFPLEPF